MNKTNINYRVLYKKIVGRSPKSDEQLNLFIRFVTEMSNNNDSNPLYYSMETLDEFADAFNKKDELKRMLNSL